MKNKLVMLVLTIFLFIFLIATIAYMLLPHDIAIDGTPIFTSNPNTGFKCWAVSAEETFYFLMIDDYYITDYNEYKNCNHMTVEGTLELVNNTYVLHVESIATS